MIMSFFVSFLTKGQKRTTNNSWYKVVTDVCGMKNEKLRDSYFYGEKLES